jgi:glutaredoxin-like protein
MSLIPDDQRERIRSELAEKLVSPVRVIMFTQAMECKFCTDTKQLIYELAELNDKIQAEIHDFVADAQLAQEYGVDKIPAIVIRTEKDYGIRFYGFPYGYEFQALMEALGSTSRGQTNLSEQTKQKLREIKTPIVIKVFTTLTCPHCPAAAAMAHKFAIENSLIRAEAIDASEFPDLAIKYGVMGVPKIVVNEKIEFVGALPEDMFLEQVLKVAQ